MFREILTAALAAVVLAGFVSPALADEVEAEAIIVGEEAPPPAAAPAPPPDKSGPYLGVGINYFIEEFDPLAVTIAGPQAGTYRHGFGDSWGFNLRGGWRFNDYLATEAVLEYADGYTSDVSYPAVGVPGENNTTQDTLWTIDFAVNVKAILPLGRVEPYVSGGIGFLYGNQLQINEIWGEDPDTGAIGQTRTSASDDPVVFMGRVAGGVDVAVTDTVGVFAEAAYLMPTSTLSDFNAIAITLGARLTF